MNFKLHKECSECLEYKEKKCKGYKFSVKIISMYCPKKHKEKNNEKK